MNDLAQTLIRSILKIGSGILVARGLMRQDQVETIIAGLLSLVGVIWGVMHRTPKNTPKGETKTPCQCKNPSP